MVIITPNGMYESKEDAKELIELFHKTHPNSKRTFKTKKEEIWTITETTKKEK